MVVGELLLAMLLSLVLLYRCKNRPTQNSKQFTPLEPPNPSLYYIQVIVPPQKGFQL